MMDALLLVADVLVRQPDGSYQRVPDPRAYSVSPDPRPGQANVYDRDGRRLGTLDTDPSGRTIYRDRDYRRR